MMKWLQQRAAAAARKQQQLRIQRIVAAIETGVRGISAEKTDAGVQLSGRALAKRWLSDPSLRFAGRISK